MGPNAKYEALTDDDLIQICKYLPIRQWPDLERIDQKFRRAIHEAWRHVRTIRLNEDFVTNKKYGRTEMESLISILEKLLYRAPNLISISFFDLNFGVDVEINENMIRLLARFKYLTSLSIRDDVMINDQNMATFLETSLSRNRLKELDVLIFFEDFVFDDQQELQPDLDLLRDAFENTNLDRSILELEKLSIKSPPIIRNRYLGASNCSLNLIDVSSLTKFDLFRCEITSIDLAPLIDRCIRLEDLAFKFMCSRNCQGPSTNPHQTLLAALKKPANLSILSMGCESIKPDCVRCQFDLRSDLTDLFKYLGLHRRLTEFLEKFEYSYNEPIVLAVTEFFVHLTNLNISIKQDCATDLLARLINLKKLQICGPAGKLINGGLLLNLSTLNRLECLRLEQFSLTNNEIGENFLSIDYNQLINLKNLKELKIVHCLLENSIFDYWEIHANWKLESFQLINWAGYTEWISGDLVGFFKKLSGLRHLDVSSNNEITNRDLEAIAIVCPNLIEISLRGCHLITSYGVRMIIDGCKKLKLVKIPSRIIREGLKINKYRNLKFVGY